MIREAKKKDRVIFNKLALHPLQSWEWGEFRKKTGLEVTRLIEFDGSKAVSSYQITWHKVPFLKRVVGYIPKSDLPSAEILKKIKDEAKKRRAIFVKLEPNIKNRLMPNYKDDVLIKKGRPLFTKYTFVLDLKKTENELLSDMNQKTRYNIRLAERKGVEVSIDNSSEAFEEYWKLTEETTKRQGFYSHTKKYHELMWRTMTKSGIGNLFKATYNGEILTTWMTFIMNNKLYYPYGASTNKHREVMANNLMMWNVIKYGKEKGCTEFDMWGSLGEDPDPKDGWYGFHKFKQGFGAELIEFMGTYDLIINLTEYNLYKVGEKIRWFILRLMKK